MEYDNAEDFKKYFFPLPFDEKVKAANKYCDYEWAYNDPELLDDRIMKVAIIRKGAEVKMTKKERILFGSLSTVSVIIAMLIGIFGSARQSQSVFMELNKVSTRQIEVTREESRMNREDTNRKISRLIEDGKERDGIDRELTKSVRNLEKLVYHLMQKK